jgi:hypothetical protein
VEEGIRYHPKRIRTNTVSILSTTIPECLPAYASPRLPESSMVGPASVRKHVIESTRLCLPDINSTMPWK